ncbi:MULTISPECIES: ATP-binding protein [unclassified Rhizobium]|uniref:ATP-binding protein n=1 Tax=unclassified Rhizobium TaxID=2613769 RepID=UPI001160CA04|nr:MULTISPECIES: ATP-binding protein [unclassified Rhizobium]TQX83377.1 HAMP domain-containing protein [Rhizobium sp. rho-13.1]TQY06447.1 HAMP domain-containing protein [Rhizobium sp. rho-1.1]
MPKTATSIPKTLRGQITLIILVALVTVIVCGRALENLAKRDFTAPNLERAVEQVKTLAMLLSQTPSADRPAIVATARRAGLDVSLAPISMVSQFKGSSELQSVAETFADLLFPPDGEPPLGGWRALLDGRRVIAQRVDEENIVVSFGFPDTIITSSFLSQSTYYFMAVIVLIVFFFIFAIRTVTEPIKKISEAATLSDISSGSRIFEERGSVEIVSLARALNGMRNRIHLMVEGRTQMLRGISHDVRTPLTRLRLRIERMGDGSTRDALLTDIDHMDRLLTESLNYLRDDYATEEVERVDVASILQTVCSDFSDVGFNMTYRGPNKMIANCRPLSMMRAVTNLCDNASKFSNSACVELRQTATGFSISVADDGPGVSEELREKVLQPFFKGDPSRRGQAGFGLGLSIVADIARSHGGSISLSSNQPHGLIARISVPDARHD